MRTRSALIACFVALALAAFWYFAPDQKPTPSVGTAEVANRTVADGRPPSEAPSPLAPVAAQSESAPAKAPAPVALPAIAPLTADAFSRFDHWSQRYLRASETERPALREEGVALAKERRPELAKLIVANPREALLRAVPMVIRQDLPAEVEAHLEKRVNGKAFYGVLGVVGGEGAPVRRHVTMENGEEMDAHVYGRRERQRTTAKALINGIALDTQLAVDERPLRVLEAGERPKTDGEVINICPISGEETPIEVAAAELPPITTETPAVEAGGSIHYLCSGGHISTFEELLNGQESGIAAEGSTGGSAKPTGTVPTTSNTGIRTHLYIRATFPEQMQDPQSEADCYDMMRRVDDFIRENSFGKCYFTTTVTPLLVLPRTEAWYKQHDSGAITLLSDARVVAKAAGYDPSQYDFDTVRYSGGPGSFGGQAYVGGKGCWLKSSSVGVAVHEYGHNLGLWHANYWNTSPASVIGPGSNSEYGNSFDTMGAASAGNNHFGAYNKSVINWMTPELVSTVRQSGVYRIFQHDQSQADPGRRYGLKIEKDSDRNYWAEFRQKFTTNAWLMSGIQLTWDAWGDGGDSSTHGSNAGPQLLDLTPGSPEGKNDSNLVIGRTFSDTESGVHITPIGKGGTVPESIDVVVNLGAFAQNQAPTLAVNASTLTVATNTDVAFSAVASDLDGDVLAYAWDFGDRSFSATNLPNVTKRWSAAGQYTVQCTVSDMKGGVATRSLVVTVGSVTAFTIRGTVLSPTNQPLEGVLVTNGQTGTAFRGAYTDTDGSYVVSNLAGGAHTISAQAVGYTFTAGFTNPVTVGPNATAKNFTSTAIPGISIAAIDPDATEAAGNGGVFRISRTGSTSAARIVRLISPSGSATRTTDYTLSPDVVFNATSEAHEVTIPVGAAFLDIAVLPVNDTTQEGPEAVMLQLVPVSGTVITGAQQATVTIADDDTALPLVRITANDGFATEGADPGQMTVIRTGSTTNALTISLAFTGTATNGSDYSKSSTLVIPSGASSVLVDLVATDDVLVEGTETVTTTINTSTAYVRGDTNSRTANVTINDNDLNVLTIAASDSSASENGDTATFTISRTGDLGSALTVDYGIGGSALHGTDYLRLPGVATIPAGLATTTITVVPVDDAIGEATQTVVIQLRSKTTYLVGSPLTATANLTDNDIPALSVTSNDGVATEPLSGTATDTLRFRIYRAGGAAAFTARYTLSGTATSGVDYGGLTGTVAFAAADTTKDITITPLADSIVEGTETVVLTLQPDPAYTIEPEGSATALIAESATTVNVSAEFVTVTEASASMRYWISRTGATTSALNVGFVMSGTATAGVDYASPTGTVSIPAAAAGVYLDLPPVNDSLAEGTETATLEIQPIAGSYVPGVARATHLLGDNDITGLPQVRFSAASSSGSEGSTSAVVPVVLSAAATSAVSVNYAITGGAATAGGVDYSMSNGTLTFAPGETSRQIMLSVVDDNRPENNEGITIALSSPAGAVLGSPPSHTYTINDNDPAPLPSVSFAAAASSIQENIGSPQNLLVTLSAASTTPVSVNYAVTQATAVSPDDYALPGTTLTFAPGEIAKFLPVNIVADGIAEGNETVVVTLSAPVQAALGPNVVHTMTIEGTPSTITVAVTGANSREPGTAGAFTVTRSGSVANPVAVSLSWSGTASNGVDYQGVPTVVHFAASQPTLVLPITPLEDELQEGDETVVLGVNPAPGYLVGVTNSATLTLRDDDANLAPSFTKGGNIQVVEDATAQTFSGWATGISAGLGESSQTVSFIISSDNTGLFSSQPTVSSNGTLAFVPAANANGVANISVQAKDNGGTAGGGVDTSAAQTFTITVLPVNDVPSFVLGSNPSVLEDSGQKTVTGFASNLVRGPENESAQTLEFLITTDSPNLFADGPVISPAGELSFTPAANAAGTASVSVRIRDSGGTANAGVDTSVVQVFAITITSTNDAPSFTKGAVTTVDEDAGPTAISNWATAVSAGPKETGQNLQFILQNDRPELFASGPRITAQGALEFTPAPNANGTASLTVQLKDDGGTANGGVDSSALESTTITIVAVNDAPTLDVVGNVVILENTSARLVDLAGITAGPAGEVEVVTITATSDNSGLIPNPTGAYSSPDSTAVLTLSPASDRNGTATITLTVNDGQSVNPTTTRTFTVSVTPVNTRPTFTKGAAQTVDEDSGPQSLGWATAIAAGPEDESGQVLRFVVSTAQTALFSSQPAISADGTLTYTPAPDAHGTATLAVTMRDDGGVQDGGVDSSTEESLSITILPVNDAPVFTKGPNQQAVQKAGRVVVPSWATGLAVGPSNESDQTLTFSVTTDNPALFTGEPTITPDGTLSFTPSASTSGFSTVTVRLQDSGGTARGGVDLSNVETFLISTDPVNDAPTFRSGGDVSAAQDAGLQTVAAWATEISPGPADEAAQVVNFFTTVDDPSLFSVPPSIDASGTLTFTPLASASGSATVSVQLKDDGGSLTGGIDTSETQSFTINVTTQAEEIGTYSGLVMAAGGGPWSNDLFGSIKINVKKKGVFTGKMKLAGQAYPLKGVFDKSGKPRFTASGTEQLTIARPSLPALTLKLHLDVSDGTDKINGALEGDGKPVSLIESNRVLYTSSRNPVAPMRNVPGELLGQFNVVFAARAPDEQGIAPGAFPQGHGIGVLTVTKKGIAKLTGTLADGTLVSCSVPLSKDQALPLHVSLHGKRGSITGPVHLRTQGSVMEADGPDLVWITPSSGSEPYPAGWPTGIQVDLKGGKFTGAVSQVIFSPLSAADIDGNVELLISGTGMEMAEPFNLAAGNLMNPISEARGIKAKVDGATGNISGSFAHPITSRRTKFKALVVPGQNAAFGFYLDGGESGSVQLLPAEQPSSR